MALVALSAEAIASALPALMMPCPNCGVCASPFIAAGFDAVAAMSAVTSATDVDGRMDLMSDAKLATCGEANDVP